MNTNDYVDVDSLSPHHHELLTLLCRYRFATTKQLTEFTCHEYGSNRTALRQTQHHLSYLADQHLVARLERRVGGWQGGSQSSIWYLTTIGYKHVNGAAGGRQYNERLSTTFLEHSLFITQICLVITRTSETNHQHAELVLEPQSWRPFLTVTAGRKVLKPDIEVTVTGSRFVDRYYIEADRATENPGRVIRTCQRYEAYRQTGIEQEAHTVFPLVIWIVPSTGRVNQLNEAISRESKLTTQLFTVITLNQLPRLIMEGPTMS